MEVWLIYRCILASDSDVLLKMTPIEYCRSKDEATKFARLFDLQLPVDLRNTVYHKTAVAEVEN